jgi:hypothetical protein
MRTTTALAALAATLALAACGGSSPSAPQSFTDSGGYSCASVAAQKDGGLCPENPLASTGAVRERHAVHGPERADLPGSFRGQRRVLPW